jgi:hypothetical protein
MIRDCRRRVVGGHCIAPGVRLMRGPFASRNALNKGGVSRWDVKR